MKKRPLSIESLEFRRLLVADGISGPAWESVIVSLRDDAGNPRVVGQDSLKAHGGQLGHIYEHSIKGFSAKLPAAAIAALAKNPQVKLIEPDLQMQAFGQTIPTGINRIDADMNLTAKIDGIDGSVSSGERVDVNIAIIDSGIDADHPDLNVVGGARFYTNNSGPPRNRGPVQDGNFDDDNGHGSHVAGIAAAIDNGIGAVGVAPGARLWAVKVLDANGSGYLSNIIAGIDWVTGTRTDADPDNDIDVANMSLGGRGAVTAYQEAIKRSVDAGVVYVVAAGNEYRDILGTDFAFGTSDDTIPAAYPEVATISAFADTDGVPGNDGGLTQYFDPIVGRYEDDTFADFSNFSNSQSNGSSYYTGNNKVTSPGLGIDLMMPGVDIYSTYKDGGYAIMSGTSMAAPHAAGLAALYIAQHGRANNAAEVYAIRQALIDGGKGWKDPEQGLHFDDPSYIPDSPDNFIENLGWAGPTVPIDQAPTINITSPNGLTSVFETVLIGADAYDDEGVASVEFFVDGVSIGMDTDEAGGWWVLWDTTGNADGPHVVTAIATDTAGQTTSHVVNVSVDNVDDPPSIAIASPLDGATVSGTTIVSAEAADDRGLEQVEFFVGGSSIGVDVDGTDGWSTSWDTQVFTDGDVTLTAKATDSSNQTAVREIAVTVSNPSQPTTMHVADLDAFSATQGKSWTAYVTVTVHDASGNPVAGAGVSGRWSGGTSGNVTLQTNSEGMVTFSERKISKNAGAVIFSVTDISGTLQYDSSTNVDPESDSNGTSIVISNPFSTSLKSERTATNTGLPIESQSTKVGAVAVGASKISTTPIWAEPDAPGASPEEIGSLIDEEVLTLLSQR